MGVGEKLFEVSLKAASAAGKAALNGAKFVGGRVADEISSEISFHQQTDQLVFVRSFVADDKRSLLMGETILLGFSLTDAQGALLAIAIPTSKKCKAMLITDGENREIGLVERGQGHNLVSIRDGLSLDLEHHLAKGYSARPETTSARLAVENGIHGPAIIFDGLPAVRFEKKNGGFSRYAAQLRILDAAYINLAFGVSVAMQSWFYYKDTGGGG